MLARGYQFVSLNIDRRKEFAKSLGVEAVPTVVVLSPDGKTPLGRIGAEALTSPQTFRDALAGLKPGAP